MQGYPALQPTISVTPGAAVNSQLLGVQPHTHVENMYYPNSQLSSPSDFTKTKVADLGSISSLPSTTPPVLITEPLSNPKLQNCISDVMIGNTYPQSLLPVEQFSQVAVSPPLLSTTNAPFDMAVRLPAHQAMVTIVEPEQIQAAPPAPCTTMGLVQEAVLVPRTAIEVHYQNCNGPVSQNEKLAESYADEAGLDVAVQPLPKPPAARRGPFKNQNDRLRTAQTRRDGSCIRCRMQRIRVSSGRPIFYFDGTDPNETSLVQPQGLQKFKG